MNKATLIVIACAALVLVNIAGFKYLGIFGLFVTGACYPLAEKLLEMISGLP
jgi:hypothetical protein